jgi:signal transduction histidine kinase
MPHKRNMLLFFALFITLKSYSQDEKAYYENILDTTVSQELKIISLDSLTNITWGQGNYDLFIKYSIALIDLAETSEKYDLMAKKAMNLTYPLATVKDNPEKATNILNRVLLYENKLTDSFLKGGLYLKRGGNYFNSNLEKAIDDYTKAINLYEEKDAVYKADAYLFRGQAYSNLGQFVRASEDYNKAYDMYEAEGDYEYMLHAKSGEIIMFSKNGFLDKSIKERALLIEELQRMKLYEYLSIQHYNQSLDYRKTGDKAKREEELLKALKYSDSANRTPYTNTIVHSGLSDFYSSTNNIQKAKYHLDLASSNLDNLQNDLYAKSMYLMALISYQIKNNQTEEAKSNALERLKILEKVGLDEETINTHLLLSEIYGAQGYKTQELYHYKKHALLKDSIYNQSKTNALVYYQTLYETERKEKALVEKKSSITLLEEKNNSLKKQYLFGGVALTMGFILLFLYKNQKNLKLNKKLNEKYTQDLLIAQEEERKRVSKDLHDGIGQSLLLIKNTVVLNKDETTKNLVENAIEEVRSISRALHPFQLQEMGITKAIENILYQIDETTELFISSEVENIDNLFDMQQGVNIYRIVQESLNNVIKHSKATAVKFTVTKTDKSISIYLKDNGVGFDFTERYNDFKSLGLKTLKERTRYLNGIMKVNSYTGKGTTLEFIIPIKNEWKNNHNCR